MAPASVQTYIGWSLVTKCWQKIWRNGDLQQSRAFLIKMLTTFLDLTAPASRKANPHCMNMTKAPIISKKNWKTSFKNFDCKTTSCRPLKVSVAKIYFFSDLSSETTEKTRRYRAGQWPLMVSVFSVVWNISVVFQNVTRSRYSILDIQLFFMRWVRKPHHVTIN